MSDILAEIEALAEKRNIRVAVLSPPQPEMCSYPDLEFLIADMGFNTVGININPEVIDKLGSVVDGPNVLKFKFENLTYLGPIEKHNPHIIYFNLVNQDVTMLLLKLTQPFLEEITDNVKSYISISGDSLKRENFLEALEFTQSSIIFNHKGYAFLERAKSAPLSLCNAIQDVIKAQYTIDDSPLVILSRLKFSLAYAYKILMDTRTTIDKALLRECELRLRLTFQTAFKEPLDKVYDKYLAN